MNSQARCSFPSNGILPRECKTHPKSRHQQASHLGSQQLPFKKLLQGSFHNHTEDDETDFPLEEATLALKHVTNSEMLECPFCLSNNRAADFTAQYTPMMPTQQSQETKNVPEFVPSETPKGNTEHYFLYCSHLKELYMRSVIMHWEKSAKNTLNCWQLALSTNSCTGDV